MKSTTNGTTWSWTMNPRKDPGLLPTRRKARNLLRIRIRTADPCKARGVALVTTIVVVARTTTSERNRTKTTKIDNRRNREVIITRNSGTARPQIMTTLTLDPRPLRDKTNSARVTSSNRGSGGTTKTTKEVRAAAAGARTTQRRGEDIGTILSGSVSTPIVSTRRGTR